MNEDIGTPSKEARLEYARDGLEITEFRHFKEDEAYGNPYNCTFDLHVRSGNFTGYAEGCEYDYKELQRFTRQLEDLYLFKTDRVELKEIGYGSTVLFEGDGVGHISISGTLFGHAKRQVLQFEFTVDQTALPPFIDQLKEF